jgi:trk system potassium uptake protein TrkH
MAAASLIAGSVSRSPWLSLAAPGLVLARLGLGLETDLEMPALALVMALHAAALLLPDGRTLRARFAGDRWTGSMVLLTAACLAVLPARTVLEAGAVLVSLRFLVQHLGALLTERLPVWSTLPFSFGMIILTGAALLMLPEATVAGISPLDSVFTSTSAVCVTGLTVVDTGATFTGFGEAVILVLIQVGGIGIMSFVAFFALFAGYRLGLGQTVSMIRSLDAEFLSDLKRVILSMVGWTLTIEATGAFLLYTSWKPVLEGVGPSRLAWLSIFHSVSAFCNAGFSLFPDNLEGFSRMPSICLIISALIVTGGLGFTVLTSLVASGLAWIRGRGRTGLDLHSRLVLTVTGILVASGAALFWLVERDGPLAGMPLHVSLSNALLESITPRTAGFDTIPTGTLHPFTRWLFMALMFIGASPGGTGGGVKTTTVGVFVVMAASLFHRRPQPELWRRRLPLHDLQRMMLVFCAGLLVCAASSGILMLTETGAGSPRTPDEYAFEAFSAFGTVGLSTGVTPELTVAGRWIIILTMFLGRIGPSALAVLTVKVRTLPYRYPAGRVGLG